MEEPASFVIGEVSWRASHCSMADRSYVLPSLANTGSCSPQAIGKQSCSQANSEEHLVQKLIGVEVQILDLRRKLLKGEHLKYGVRDRAREHLIQVCGRDHGVAGGGRQLAPTNLGSLAQAARQLRQRPQRRRLPCSNIKTGISKLSTCTALDLVLVR